jgi:type VI secretion system secreted protein VgrG
MAHTFDYTFAVDGLDADLAVLRFDGVEGVSQPYRFDLALTSHDPDIAFEDVVGKNAALQWITSDEPRLVHGIVSHFEFSGQGRKLTYYTARLVPKLWSLSLRRQSRIFQEKTTQDILKDVLQKGGLPSDAVEFQLKRSYKPRKFCVQYRESDFAFACRMMEEEGMFYFFRHEEAKHVMVIADAASVHEAMPGDPVVVYRGGESGMSGGEAIKRFTFRRAMRTGAVALQEFDFKRPTLDLMSEKAADVETELESYEYPGAYPDTDHGKTYAQIRLEEQRAEKDVGAGAGDCRRMIPGFRWSLDEHPRAEFNAEYVLTSVSHTAEQPQAAEEDHEGGEPLGETTYANDFLCIPSAVTYRPPRITPLPSVDGVQTAIVTGPPGEEIHTDEFGRVKIKFHWDREGPNDDKSSYWVRVAQAQSFGSMLLPRVGWEVVVDFQEGDPNRPLIIGRLHNGGDPGPYGLPGAKTRTALVSQSSPGGGNANEIRFEDAAGSEEFYVHASKDWNILVDNNESHHVTKNRTKNIDVDQTEVVGANNKIDVGGNHDEKIKGNMTLGVDGDEKETIVGNRTIGVNGDHTEKVSGTMKLTVMRSHKEKVLISWSKLVGGMMSLTVGGKMSLRSVGSCAEKIRGDKTSDYGKKHTVKVKSDQAITVGGKKSEEVTGDRTDSCKAKQTVSVADAYELTAKKIQLTAQDEIVLQSGQSKITLKSDGTISINGKDVKVEAMKDFKAKATQVEVNGSAKNDLKGAMVTLEASGINTIKGSLVKIN